MATWSRADPGRRRGEAGFTLFEMMVALAIGAVFAAGLAGLSRTISPRVELRAAAERIAGDFERARMEARRTGRPVTVRLESDGYVIDALALSGGWGGARARLDGAEVNAASLTLAPGPFTAPPAALSLQRGALTATVEIGAASGRAEARLDPR